jgi:HD-like signal output (HDOD) protein
MSWSRIATQSRRTQQDARPDLRHSRKERLITLATEDFSAASSPVSELISLFNRQPVNLSLIKRIIDDHPSLSSEILRLCNATLSNQHQHSLGLEEASVLLGCDSMKRIVLRSFLLDFTRQWLSGTDLRRFWQHSILVAMLSERIAHLLGYSEGDRVSKYAYLGGIFHDVGILPLLGMTADENEFCENPRIYSDCSSLAEEKERFGLDHCEVAQIIGPFWNFFPGCSEIIVHHHSPHLTPRYRDLVGVVGAADIMCEACGFTPACAADSNDGLNSSFWDDLFALRFPGMKKNRRADLMETLETEHLHLLQLSEFESDDFSEVFGNI